jgi:hypothetical protein
MYRREHLVYEIRHVDVPKDLISNRSSMRQELTRTTTDTQRVLKVPF